MLLLTLTTPNSFTIEFADGTSNYLDNTYSCGVFCD